MHYCAATSLLPGRTETANPAARDHSPHVTTPLSPNPSLWQNGFDIIYEARDLDLPQSVREGFTQVRVQHSARALHSPCGPL